MKLGTCFNEDHKSLMNPILKQKKLCHVNEPKWLRRLKVIVILFITIIFFKINFFVLKVPSCTDEWSLACLKMFLQFLFSFLFISKTLQLNNLESRAAMNAKISVFCICVKAIIYLLLCNLHDCTFKSKAICQWSYKNISKSAF